MLLGLTGKYCAGKNYIASLFEMRGVPVLDVDKLGYLALETEKEAVFTQFGRELQKTDGSLDRQLLGKIVFSNPEKLKILESIIHPPVNRLTEDWIRDKAGYRAQIINAALLHKSVVFNRLDKIIIITAPFLTRFIRARKRDKLPLREILRRFTSQKDFYTQYLSGKAEIYRIENSGLHSRSGLAGSGNKKLENRIDKFLEGI